MDLKWTHPTVAAKFLIASTNIKKLLQQIKEIEDDSVTPANEKLSQIKMIREEIAKVAEEIDNLKKEIRLLNTYRVN